MDTSCIGLRSHPSPVASLVAQMVKNLPAMQKTQVRSLAWEYPLGEKMRLKQGLHVSQPLVPHSPPYPFPSKSPIREVTYLRHWDIPKEKKKTI